MKKLSILWGLISVIVLLLVFCGSTVYAAIPHLINFQGMLTDSSGAVLDGSYNITFRIYDDSTAGNLQWLEKLIGVQVLDGLFDVALGGETPLNLAFDEPYWLEVEVNGEIMPRTRINSVAYAFRALVADSALVAIAIADTLAGKILKSPVVNIKVSGTAVLDEDDMISDSDSSLATQQSIKAYVDNQLVGGDFADTTFTVYDEADNTRVLTFETSGITSGNTRTLSVPDYDGTMATLDGAETLTNKNLTSPAIISSPTAAGAIWTDLGRVTTADIDGGTIDGTIIGATTPAAGTFADLQSGWDGTDGRLIVFSEQGATDYTVFFQPNAAMTETTGYTLPAFDGLADQVLTTDGSGMLSWTSPSGSGDITAVGDATNAEAFTVDGAGNVLYFEGTTADDFEIALQGADAVADVTLTLPAVTDVLVGRATIDILSNKILTSPVLSTSVSGSAVLDEDDMSSNSATQLATQQSIRAYVDNQVILGDFADSTFTVYDEADNTKVLTFETSGITSGNTRTLTAPDVDGTILTAVVQDATPQLGGQLDLNGNALGDGTAELLKFIETASAVNELTITNAATGNAPQLSATGDDADIDFEINARGTGDLILQNSATGNVGIGTSSPTTTLHIGGIPGTDGIRFPDGSFMTSAGVGSAGSVSNDGDAAITADADGNAVGAIRLLTGSNPRMYIANTGDVGIGTSSPLSRLHLVPSTAAALQIDPFGSGPGDTGQLRFLELAANGSNYSGFRAPDDLAGNVIWTLPDADGSANQVLSTDGSGNLSWSTHVLIDLVDNTTDAYKMQQGTYNYFNINTTDLSEQITFGNTTTNPTFAFNGTGNVGIGTTSPGNLLHVQTNIDNQKVHIQTDVVNGDIGLALKNDIQEWLIQAKGSDADKLVFHDELRAATRMVIDIAGNVGIGTTTPGSPLEVNGDIHTTDVDDRIYFGASTQNEIGRTKWACQSNLGLTIESRHNNGEIIFETKDIERVRIGKDGDVGIGTPTPGNILSVVQSSSTDPIADAWTNYSSLRWKENIQPIEGALSKVKALRGVNFNWKADGKHDIGMIAEEVGEVIPEVVVYEDNGTDAQSLDYARLVAILIEAIKEQQKQIEALEAQLDLKQ